MKFKARCAEGTVTCSGTARPSKAPPLLFPSASFFDCQSLLRVFSASSSSFPSSFSSSSSPACLVSFDGTFTERDVSSLERP